MEIATRVGERMPETRSGDMSVSAARVARSKCVGGASQGGQGRWMTAGMYMEEEEEGAGLLVAEKCFF